MTVPAVTTVTVPLPALPGANAPPTTAVETPMEIWSELFCAAAVADATHNRAAAAPSVRSEFVIIDSPDRVKSSVI
jgi:hypothetical protein